MEISTLFIFLMSIIPENPNSSSILIHNSDPVVHTTTVQCSGLIKKLNFEPLVSKRYKIDSIEESCSIIDSTAFFPTDTLMDKQAWQLKNGRAVVQKTSYLSVP